ncbi:hypothetical protein, partial [Mesorhizobium sp. M2C.T.Ca.TU.002.02.1.1]|uniref:hypothetical protein n=1 Tax=Mesorhizobium sp. M2C.T.Ca.TU.002.02.1.1 TaxID=2496788 RepID=UPI0019D07D9B
MNILSSWQSPQPALKRAASDMGCQAESPAPEGAPRFSGIALELVVDLADDGVFRIAVPEK